MPIERREFRIGYNLIWRVTFFVFALCMLGASFVLLIQSLFGFSEGLFVPSSMLVAVVLMCLYLIPFISMRRQVLVVGPDVTDIDAINATGNILAHQWRTPSKPTTLLG